MRIFLSRYGICLSKPTVHKYMNKVLNLSAVLMRKKHGIIQSMSKAGCPYDNAPMERFYNTFQSCFYYRVTFESTKMLDEMTREYMNWYHYVRPHSYNNYLTPMEVRFSSVFIEQSVTKKLDQYTSCRITHLESAFLIFIKNAPFPTNF